MKFVTTVMKSGPQWKIRILAVSACWQSKVADILSYWSHIISLILNILPLGHYPFLASLPIDCWWMNLSLVKFSFLIETTVQAWPFVFYSQTCWFSFRNSSVGLFVPLRLTKSKSFLLIFWSKISIGCWIWKTIGFRFWIPPWRFIWANMVDTVYLKSQYLSGNFYNARMRSKGWLVTLDSDFFHSSNIDLMHF